MMGVTIGGWAGGGSMVVTRASKACIYAWGRRCTYCNDCRSNALTNKPFFTTLFMSFPPQGTTATIAWRSSSTG